MQKFPINIMAKVLGMGNALVDILLRLDSDAVLERLEMPRGSMQLVDKHTAEKVMKATGHNGATKASGGSAANTIHGLANLGIKTGFLGKIGRDELGNFFKNDLLNKGIDPILLESETESGRAIALISPDSERTFATYLGAAVEMRADDIPDEVLKNYSYLHIEGYLVQNQELIREGLRRAKQYGLKVSLDLASFNVVEENLEFLRDNVARYVEARAFSGGLEGEEALEWMGQMCETVVLKQGAKGSLIKHNGQKVSVGSVICNPIDTTGAGDLYAAGFLFGLIRSLPVHKCGEIGALLSARVIEVIGPKMDEERWNAIRNELLVLAE
jgi:sugar/nucleoside kinase (ribokinase family)